MPPPMYSSLHAEVFFHEYCYSEHTLLKNLLLFFLLLLVLPIGFGDQRADLVSAGGGLERMKKKKIHFVCL